MSKSPIALSLGYFIFFSVTFFPASWARADEGEKRPVAGSNADLSSPNFQKSDQFLPGEEIVTPTGQKMKVWSTNGPVAVDRAPEPFEDREKSVLDNAAVVVDVDDNVKRHHRRPESTPDSESTHDR